MNEEKFETGFYRILIDEVFSVAEMTEYGWCFIDGDCWGAVTIIDKISERQTTTELPNEEKTKALGISGVSNRRGLLDYHKWYLKNRGLLSDSAPEYMVEEYLIQ